MSAKEELTIQRIKLESDGIIQLHFSMWENLTGEVNVRPDINSFQQTFVSAVQQLDQYAEGVSFKTKSNLANAAFESFEDPSFARRFRKTTASHEEFMRAQLAKRDLTHFGPISSAAAEIIFEATREQVGLSPDIYQDGTYLLEWKPKFLTGYITGSNPLNIATWRFELAYEPAGWRSPSIGIDYQTDWSNWTKFTTNNLLQFSIDGKTEE